MANSTKKFLKVVDKYQNLPWLDTIDNQNLLWNEIIKHEDANKAFQFSCKNGYSKMLEMLFQKTAEFKIDYNPSDQQGWTAFHYACQNGHSRSSEMLIQSVQY